MEQYVTGGEERYGSMPPVLLWPLGLLLIFFLIWKLWEPGKSVWEWGKGLMADNGEEYSSRSNYRTGRRERAEGDEVQETDDIYQQGGYGDYGDGTFGGEPVDLVDAEAAKAKFAADADKALTDLWTRLGGENSCDLPVSSRALSEGMSLMAANGDVACDGKNEFFGAHLGDDEVYPSDPIPAPEN